MPKSLLVTFAVLAVAVGTAATWASAGARQPTSATPMHSMAGMKMQAVTSPALANALSKARLATGKYVTNLPAAKAAGYSIITKMIPDMGWHFLNGKITGFDPAKPPILVYERRGSAWQLAALEWVFTAKPKTPPLPGATLRRVPRRVPLRGRHVRPGRVAGRVRHDGSRLRREVHVLAPEPDHDARLALVPEPERALREHEPAGAPLQRRLISGGEVPAAADQRGGGNTITERDREGRSCCPRARPHRTSRRGRGRRPGRPAG